jgi:hypothetical protein
MLLAQVLIRHPERAFIIQIIFNYERKTVAIGEITQFRVFEGKIAVQSVTHIFGQISSCYLVLCPVISYQNPKFHQPKLDYQGIQFSLKNRFVEQPVRILLYKFLDDFCFVLQMLN